MSECPVCHYGLWSRHHDGVVHQTIRNEVESGAVFICEGQLVFRDYESKVMTLRDDPDKIRELAYLTTRMHACFF